MRTEPELVRKALRSFNTLMYNTIACLKREEYASFYRGAKVGVHVFERCGTMGCM
jgi:hypothetical protein